MNNLADYMFDDSKLDERTIQMYERRIRNEEQVPAIVLRADGERFEVIDGFHRIAAMDRCGITQMKGTYVVSCPPEDVPSLRRALNRREGN